MKDLTQGSTTRHIITMAIPIAAGMIFQMLYLLVDLYFVAALGEQSMAGVGTAGTLLFMIMAITQILSCRKEGTSRSKPVFQSIVFAFNCFHDSHSSERLSIRRHLSQQHNQ